MSTPPHVASTGCNLRYEDFLPGDPVCADGGYAWEHPLADGTYGAPRWVYIERGNFGVADHPAPLPDVYVGPFVGPNADEDAATCMNDSLLVDHLMQREGGGGTDCYVTVEQPDADRDDIHLIDHDDPYQTGKYRECAEGGHINDDNIDRPICQTCDDDPAVAALYPEVSA